MNKITEQQKKRWFKAVRDKDIETVKNMIKNGADINKQDEYGWTALHWSCYYNRIEIVNFLIENSADVNIQEIVRWTTPLHIACVVGYIEMAKLLIDNGADITIKDIDGYIPFHELKSYPEQYEELMQWLTENHPEKALELMASDNIQGKGVGL